jgi:TetR/AcrR family transcriptional regulator, mexJK operon transcriptional repressor
LATSTALLEQAKTEAAQNMTARKILDTAARLFMQLGYRAVSINDIVKAAEITKPTLYYYFRNKEELFAQMAIQRLADIHQALEGALAGKQGTQARLAGMAGVLLNASDGDMRLLRHEIATHLSPEHRRRLAQAFQRYMFEPVRQVMQQGLDSGALARHSAAELTMLFLGLMEAFHGFTEQVDDLHLPEEAGRIRPAVFAPEPVVGLFLHGVADNEEAGDIQ